jgi:CRP-like cAMP-binding protein
MAEASPAFLAGVPLFEGLSKKELENLAHSMVERTWRAGDVITTEGGPSAVSFFVIESGTVGVDVGGQQRRSLGRGDYFGEISLMGGTDRTATLTAETAVHAFGMTPWVFRPLVESNATLSFRLLETISKRLSGNV